MKTLLTSKNLLKFTNRLCLSDTDRSAFLTNLTNSQRHRGTILWVKPRPDPNPFPCRERPTWLPEFVDIVAEGVKPGSHKIHEQGMYYCLDLSSVFTASIILSLRDLFPPNSLDILDLCASPGGKSVFATVSLKPRSLVCNEVIGKRIPQLRSNLRRCEIEAQITNRDSSVLSREVPEAFDIVLVDAPCSGQSLITGMEKKTGCFHPATINLNSNRQKRILANASKLLRPGGYLAYMTCTYSKEENEGVIEWFLKNFHNYKIAEAPHLHQYQSELTDIPCYRAWPQTGLGLGGFAALMQNDS